MYQNKLSFFARVALSSIAFGIVSYINYGFTTKALLITLILLAVATPFSYLIERIFSMLVKKLP